MKTAEEIVNLMKEEMPFFFHDGIRPYIIESMKIYANQKLDEAADKVNYPYRDEYGCMCNVPSIVLNLKDDV